MLCWELIMKRITFWNNKGGTGKTSLLFQTICTYAKNHPDEKVLVIDVCPQANLSELLLGGLEGAGSNNLLAIHGASVRKSVGGYFQSRLPSPYAPGTIVPTDFIVTPRTYNRNIPQNVELLSGDPLLELQANAMATLANNQIPGTDTWAKIVSWLSDFLDATQGGYDVVFMDSNPSFSIYTQTAIACTETLVLPVMADDSSKRAVENALSLVYGLKLPSAIYSQHLFSTKMKAAGLGLPKVGLIVKNRITQYMGAASGYRAVLDTIDDMIENMIASHPNLLKFNSIADGVIEVRDFQTTGVVAFARGTPFYELSPGSLAVAGRRIQVNGDQLTDRQAEIEILASKI